MVVDALQAVQRNLRVVSRIFGSVRLEGPGEAGGSAAGWNSF